MGRRSEYKFMTENLHFHHLSSAVNDVLASKILSRIPPSSPIKLFPKNHNQLLILGIDQLRYQLCQLIIGFWLWDFGKTPVIDYQSCHLNITATCGWHFLACSAPNK